MKITVITDEKVITGTVHGEPYIAHDAAAEYYQQHPEECGQAALPSDRLKHCKPDVFIEDALPCTYPPHSGAFGQEPMAPSNEHPTSCSCHTCQCNGATQAVETIPPCAEGDELHLVLKVTGVMNRNERRSN